MEDQKLKVLYTSEAVHKQIKALFSEPARKDERIAVVAYVGRDGPSMLPSPKGMTIVCSPVPTGTSHVALKELQRRGAIIKVADRLHAKVYYSSTRGCIIGSANLSKNALGVGGLAEAAVYVLPGVVDIDKILRAVKPRDLTASDLTALAAGERKAGAGGRWKGKHRPKVAFLDWFAEVREGDWKLGWWNEPTEGYCGPALSQARLEYSREPHDFIACAANQIALYDWVLHVEFAGNSVGELRWMFTDYVVQVPPDESEHYEEANPYHAVQVHALEMYPAPPFELSARTKVAIRQSLIAYGLDKVKGWTTLTPPQELLRISRSA